MPWVVQAILTLEGLLAAAALVAIILLAVRRIRLRKEETFEKRDH